MTSASGNKTLQGLAWFSQVEETLGTLLTGTDVAYNCGDKFRQADGSDRCKNHLPDFRRFAGHGFTFDKNLHETAVQKTLYITLPLISWKLCLI